MGLAATQLGVAATSLSVTDGVVSGGGKTVTYGALIGDKVFSVRIPNVPAGSTSMPAAAQKAAGATGTKAIASYKLVGKPGIARIDIPDKVSGRFTYVHNIKVPGMVHGRVVRPRGQGAYGGGTAPAVARGRRELDQAESERAGRPLQGLRRRGRGDRVAGDPGRGPAEGDVG